MRSRPWWHRCPFQGSPGRGDTVAPWTPRSSPGTFQLHCCCFEGQVSPADTLGSVFLPESLKISWIPDIGTCLPTALPSRRARGQPSAPGDRARPAPVLLLSTDGEDPGAKEDHSPCHGLSQGGTVPGGARARHKLCLTSATHPAASERVPVHGQEGGKGLFGTTEPRPYRARRLRIGVDAACSEGAEGLSQMGFPCASLGKHAAPENFPTEPVTHSWLCQAASWH